MHPKVDVGYLGTMLDAHCASHADLFYYSQFSNCLPDLAFDDEVDFKQYQIFKSGHGLLTPWRAILGSKKRIAVGNQQTEIQRFEKPTDYITVQHGTSDGPRQVVAERRCIDRFLQNIWRLNAPRETAVSSWKLDVNTIAEGIGQTLAGQSTPITSDTVLGLQLLVESSKSYMFPKDAAMKTTNCRIEALKFTADVKKSVTNTRNHRPPMPLDACPPNCNCLEAKLAKGLNILEDNLTAFTAEKCFDLYNQMPWVAVSYMVWMLSQANDYGMVLCNRFRHMGSVLHLYNWLRQLDLIEKNQVLLEKLCEMLQAQIFQGPPPKRDFFDKWADYVGDRLGQTGF